MRRESCTNDELIHLPAGYTYLLKRDFRLNPEHPPLIKVLCALPLLALHPKIDFSDPSWIGSPRQSTFGSKFLYSNDAGRLLLRGRSIALLISLLLGFFTFRWAQQMYGNVSGVIALVLFCFSPSLIAHSHLITTDVGVTAFLTISFYFLWKYRKFSRKASLAWSAFAMGAALASKFSALVFFPMAILLIWAKPSSGSSGDHDFDRNKWPASPQEVPKTSPKKTGRGGSPTDLPWPRMFLKSFLTRSTSKWLAGMTFIAIAVVVAQLAYLGSPDLSLYLKGFDQIQKNHLSFVPHYLHGELKEGTWWYYFLVAFLVKETVGLILLLLIRLIRFFRHFKFEGESFAFLVLPSLVYFVAVSVRADPLGIRYLLPVFPFLMIFSSNAIEYLIRQKFAVWAIWILLAAHVASSLAAFPHHLSYFNEGVGGPSHGMDWLDDSNVDWGQELKALKKVLDERHISNVTLYSFSRFDNPEYYGIHCVRPNPEEWAAIMSAERPASGVYVVSAHWLAHQKALGFDWIKNFPVIANLGNSMFVFQIL